jgi:putative ABC transport system substrate-binding protein
VEILKEVVPKASRVALLTPQASSDSPYGQAIRRAGAQVGMTVIGALLGDPIHQPEYRRAFAAMVRARVEALVVGDNTENYTHRQLIVELGAQARLPAIYPFRERLMAYSVDIGAMFRDAAGYVDRILKGADPGKLPLELTRFGGR